MKKEQLLKRFSNLNYSKQQELIELLTNQVIESRPILNHKEKPSSCPHCNHNKIYKHGVYKIKNKGKEAKITGGTRYKCQGCKKTFNELTGTSIHAIKKTNKFRKFVELMLESKSIREAAQELNVSTKTIFDWRHKILASFENIFTRNLKELLKQMM
jgi:transposase-like protein